MIDADPGGPDLRRQREEVGAEAGQVAVVEAGRAEGRVAAALQVEAAVEDAVGVDPAVAEDLGRDPVFGAELGERRRGREQLHVRGQRPRAAGRAGADDLRGFRPRRRAARWPRRRPACSQARIWSQAGLAWALLATSRKRPRRATTSRIGAAFHRPLPTRERRQGSGPSDLACSRLEILHGSMGKVVDIESKPRRRSARPQKALEDGSGPRRGRLHRRRLRDRRPARARPAGGQQHRQQLRRLRRHQRRLLRRLDARQRRHPRRDDAGAERARPLRARGPRPRQGPEAELPRLPQQSRGAAAAHAGAGALAGADRRALGDRHRRRPRRGAADRPLLGLGPRRLRRARRSATAAGSTTSACSTASST